MPISVIRTAFLWLMGGLLVACGGGGGSGGGNKNASTIAVTVTTAPARGDLLANPPNRLASYSTNDLLAQLTSDKIGKTLLNLALTPKCAIDVYQLRYSTVDAKGNITPASAALMVPSGSSNSCSGARPIVLYAHGTTADRAFNIANITASNAEEGLLLATAFAAQGYIAVAPNYVGYDTSTLNYHPYLNADQQSKDMMDALHAARAALPVASASSTTDSGKLFITGYSEGGYVAMATHRAMQAAGMVVTASAPMSGPYALSAFGDAIFLGQVSKGSPENVALIIASYQHAYGDIYVSTADVFEGKYATGIDTLLPSATALSDLQNQGKIPGSILFSTVPPNASYASVTPATSPAQFVAVFAKGFGVDNLVTNAYRLDYLQDAQAQPDGGFPTIASGLPPVNPVNKLRAAFKTNDLRNWTPTSPVLLCAGNSDPTVFYLNTALMQGYWTAHPPTIAAVVVDIDASPSNGDPYSNLKAGFLSAKNAVRAAAVAGGDSDGGDKAVLDAYHAQLVAPFCASVVKSFFDGL